MADLNNPTAHGKRGRQSAKALFEDGTYDLQNFHDTFLKLEDPTEYEAALELVGSWVQWERLKRDWPAFRTHIQNWKAELEVKLKSRAIKQVNELAFDGNFQASKWIAENGWERRAGAGRPTAAEKKRAEREVAQKASETSSEKARILKVMNFDKG